MELIPNCFDIVQFACCLDHPFDRNQCLALGHQTLSSAEHNLLIRRGCRPSDRQWRVGDNQAF
jgi:hypothetical protein